MITFVVKESRDCSPRNIDPAHAFLQLDLQEFLATATEFPAIARLSELYVYDDTFIEGERLDALIQDLSRLALMLDKQEITLHVPDEVGTTSDEDLRQEFGEVGFRQWVCDLLILAKMAKERDTPLTAAGD